MSQFPVSTWAAVAAGLSWCLLATYWLVPYWEPLLGFGQRGCTQMLCFEGLLALVCIFLAHYRKRVLACIIGGVALLYVMALPLASKAGVLFRLRNDSLRATEVGIARADDPKRRILLSVPAGQSVSYRTAPGDYSEGLQFLLESGTNRLRTSVWELRRGVVYVSETNLWLSESEKK